jgi:uncharacterized protein (TIGR04255 family)
MTVAMTMNFEESFPYLPMAPIAEAVIHWKATPVQAFDPDELLKQLQKRLPDYPQLQPQHEFSIEHEVGPHGAKFNQSHSWQAYQLSNADRTYVAQFNRMGLVFSRLPPYQRWAPFSKEAMRVWDIYKQIADPPEIQRLGIRYINMVSIDSIAEARQMLSRPPEFPGAFELPLANYVHQSRFDVPGHRLQLNLVQTVQPAAPGSEMRLNLIVDIDIFSTGKRVAMDEFRSGNLFQKMRWLKNKTFFNIFSETAIKKFRG